MTTHEDRIATLEQNLATLRQRFDALESETPEDRANREQRTWERQRQESARAEDLRRKQARLAEIDTQLGFHVPWMDYLAALRAEVKPLLDAARKRLAEDPTDVRHLEVEELEDTLLCLDGARDWRTSGGDLHARVGNSGFPCLPGYRHPLDGRFMLGNTMRTVAALRKDREIAQAELDALTS
jgi:hypothetical protein